jgi:hypothetical protein
MQSFPVLTIDTAPEKSKPALQALQGAFGMIPNVAGTMATSPVLIDSLVALFGKVHGGSFADLISSYDRLRKVGVEPAFCLDHGLTISIYYEDPEGNYVELQSDNFADWKLSTEYMRTRAFAENPIGRFFDPGHVYENFKFGSDFRTLQKDIRAGCYLPKQIPNIGLPA